MEVTPPISTYPGDMQIAFYYATQGFPIVIADGKDMQQYENFTKDPPGIVVRCGSAARMIDFPPGFKTPMHRSLSLNYNFVIEGEVEVILDSGETRILKRGDGLVQRAINHAWRNVSDTEWARISAVVLPVQTFQIGGKEVEANLPS